VAEVRKPGANNKVVAVPCIYQLKTELLVINAFSIFFKCFRYIQQLKIGMKVSKASGKLA